MQRYILHFNLALIKKISNSYGIQKASYHYPPDETWIKLDRSSIVEKIQYLKIMGKFYNCCKDLDRNLVQNGTKVVIRQKGTKFETKMWDILPSKEFRIQKKFKENVLQVGMLVKKGNIITYWLTRLFNVLWKRYKVQKNRKTTCSNYKSKVFQI